MTVVLTNALPLIPDGDEARRWAEQELAGPEYQIARPTPFDTFVRDAWDFITSLFSGSLPPEIGPVFAVIATAVVVALIAIAFAVWGRPRVTARSRAHADLFGHDESRTAAELRRDAASAARQSAWDDAIILRMRAIARALSERTILDPEPGATVHRFARQAGGAFPGEAGALESAASDFDDVRYLRRAGTADAYDRIMSLDDRLAASLPVESVLQGPVIEGRVPA